MKDVNLEIGKLLQLAKLHKHMEGIKLVGKASQIKL